MCKLPMSRGLNHEQPKQHVLLENHREMFASRMDQVDTGYGPQVPCLHALFDNRHVTQIHTNT